MLSVPEDLSESESEVCPASCYTDIRLNQKKIKQHPVSLLKSHGTVKKCYEKCVHITSFKKNAGAFHHCMVFLG